MESLPNDSMRRAALTLHAVGEADREWLLSSLPVARQLELERLLTELATLGIPPDARLVADLCSSSPEFHAVTAKERGAPDLGGADVAVLLRLALLEPPAIVAGICGAAGAQWRDRLLATLAPDLRAAVERHETRLTCAPALRAAILDATAKCVRPGVGEPRRGRATWWQRLRTGLPTVRRTA